MNSAINEMDFGMGCDAVNILHYVYDSVCPTEIEDHSQRLLSLVKSR